MIYQFEKSNLWQRWRSFWVDLIKTRSIRLLNKTPQGELFLLKMYFAAEKNTVVGINEKLQALPMPEWLKEDLRIHLQEEGHHIKLFASAIRSYGESPPKSNESSFIDWAKLKPWFKLSKQYESQFVHGALIPAYVIGECAEYMLVRVLSRHEKELPTKHPLKEMLQNILSDERRHLQICYQTLERLVLPEEQATLERLRKQVYQVDLSWGVSSALAHYFVGLYFFALRLTHRVK